MVFQTASPPVLQRRVQPPPIPDLADSLQAMQLAPVKQLKLATSAPVQTPPPETGFNLLMRIAHFGQGQFREVPLSVVLSDMARAWRHSYYDISPVS